MTDMWDTVPREKGEGLFTGFTVSIRIISLTVTGDPLHFHCNYECNHFKERTIYRT